MELLHWCALNNDPRKSSLLTCLGTPVLTQSDFPDDIDTTSLGTTILDSPACKANHIMDLMLRYLSPDGIIQASFRSRYNIHTALT
jgi:hypothetical protein